MDPIQVGEPTQTVDETDVSYANKLIVDELESLGNNISASFYPETVYVNVYSGDRINPTQTSSSKFSVGLRTPLICPPENHFVVSIANLSIPYSFYQCADYHTNNIIRVQYQTDPIDELIIPNGTYTTAQMMNVCKTLLDPWINTKTGGSPSYFNFTQDSITGKITMEFHDVGSSVTFYWSDSDTNSWFLGFTHGFEGYPTMEIAGIGSRVGRDVPDPLHVDKIFLTSNLALLNSYSTSTSGSSSELAQVMVNNLCVPGQCQLVSSNATPEEHPIRTRYISMLSFELSDNNNEQIDLNGLDWSFTMVFKVAPSAEGRTGMKRSRESSHQRATRQMETNEVSKRQAPTALHKELLQINLRNNMNLQSIAARLNNAV